MVRSTSLAIEIAHAHGLLRHGYFLLMVMIVLRADAVPLMVCGSVKEWVVAHLVSLIQVGRPPDTSRAGDIEQQKSTDNANVLVEVDRVRGSVGAVHGPEVVPDERGRQCVEREQ